jgi:uncharacterized protein YjbJ (UPF0337 family)
MRSSTTNQESAKKSAPPKVAPFAPKIVAKIMSKWSKISESDVDAMNGSFEMLSAKIQEAYSYPKAKCDKECADFKRANKLE